MCPSTFKRMRFTRKPRTLIQNMYGALISSNAKKRWNASHKRIAVRAQTIMIDINAPRTSACLKPYVYSSVAAVAASFKQTKDTMNPAQSDSIWAASVIMAKEFAKMPPKISMAMMVKAK